MVKQAFKKMVKPKRGFLRSLSPIKKHRGMAIKRNHQSQNNALKQLQQQELKRLTTLHRLINAYQLVCTYAPSHRPGTYTLNTTLPGSGEFVIHSLRPSVLTPQPDDTVKVRNVHSTTLANLNLEKPQVRRDIRAKMERYWPCLRVGVTHKFFIEQQASKHGRYHKMSKSEHYFTQGLDLGMRYVAAEGDMYLMRILKENGFVAGQVHSCSRLLDVLKRENKGGVNVTFRDSPDLKGLKLLDEVTFLFHLDFEKIDKNQAPKFMENDMFYLEDLNVRFG